MKNYFIFISKLFHIILILTIPNFIGYGQQPCPKPLCPNEINHNQGTGHCPTTIYVYNSNHKIIGEGECSFNGGGHANCKNVLDSLNKFLPEVASYLSFGNIATDLGSCLYDTLGIKIDPLLPVELLYFKPVVKDGTVVLNWATGSETNNDYFTIERSLDGYNWDSILSISGQGNSTTRTDYKLYDRVFGLSGIVYYRLSQTDYDGKSKIFDMKSCFIHKRKVVKIVNTLGQEVDINYKGLKIVIYDNGELIIYI